MREIEAIDTVVIGGGQAGLSVGYHLARRGVPFVILDANQRVGDCWRQRWDSLRLFTPASFDGLDGMPFPAPPNSLPDQGRDGRLPRGLCAAVLAAGADGRTGRPDLEGGRSADRVTSGTGGFEADNVVVAMADFQRPRIPAFADELDRGIVQLHSQRVPQPRAAPARRRAARGRRELGSGDRARASPGPGTRPASRDATPASSRSGSTACRRLVLARLLFRVGVLPRADARHRRWAGRRGPRIGGARDAAHPREVARPGRRRGPAGAAHGGCARRTPAARRRPRRSA